MDDNIIWHMHIACCITKATCMRVRTHTHTLIIFSTYDFPIAIMIKQMLSLLHYMYIGCLVFIKNNKDMLAYHFFQIESQFSKKFLKTFTRKKHIFFILCWNFHKYAHGQIYSIGKRSWCDIQDVFRWKCFVPFLLQVFSISVNFIISGLYFCIKFKVFALLHCTPSLSCAVVTAGVLFKKKY